MNKSRLSISITDIVLDNDVYPRSAIDHKRVGLFAENIRDGFEFEAIHVQELPEEKGKYRILDGAHRWQAHKTVVVNDQLHFQYLLNLVLGYFDMPSLRYLSLPHH